MTSLYKMFFVIVLEYVEGSSVCGSSGTLGGIGEITSRRYLRDIIAGLVYLHAHVSYSVFPFF